MMRWGLSGLGGVVVDPLLALEPFLMAAATKATDGTKTRCQLAGAAARDCAPCVMALEKFKKTLQKATTTFNTFGWVFLCRDCRSFFFFCVPLATTAAFTWPTTTLFFFENIGMQKKISLSTSRQSRTFFSQ